MVPLLPGLVILHSPPDIRMQQVQVGTELPIHEQLSWRDPSGRVGDHSVLEQQPGYEGLKRSLHLFDTLLYYLDCMFCQTVRGRMVGYRGHMLNPVLLQELLELSTCEGRPNVRY